MWAGVGAKIDSLAPVLLDLPSGQSLFTCSVQMFPHQRVQIIGEKGRIEIEIPFNAPPDRPRARRRLGPAIIETDGNCYG